LDVPDGGARHYFFWGLLSSWGERELLVNQLMIAAGAHPTGKVAVAPD
jgi:hypothetical protein